MIQLSVNLFDNKIINIYSNNSKFIGFYDYKKNIFVPNLCEEFYILIEKINYDEFVLIVYNKCNNFLNENNEYN